MPTETPENPGLSRDHILGDGFEGKKWWARQDSNLQPDGYEPSALTS